MQDDMKAVIFDFDGLILDTETTGFEVWRETFAAHGLELRLEQWAANIGGNGFDQFHPFEELERGYAQPKDWDAVHETRRARYWALLDAQDCLPGVRAALESARGMGLRIGLASSSNRQTLLNQLERLGLHEYFDALRGGDEVDAIKPDPALYLKVLRDLQVRPDQAFALEDSARGVAAAKAAGLYCVAVANPVTRVLQLDHADRRLASLDCQPFETLVREIRERLADAV